jgi:glucan-binding YG repeat protein
MAQRKIRARYKVVGPRKELVTYTKAVMVRDELQEGKVHTMELQPVTEEMETFMVLFPQGHSIRVTSRRKLEELGYHLKPRMVDMETGDVVDIGGSPYDFDDMSGPEPDILIDEDIRPANKRRTADANVS